MSLVNVERGATLLLVGDAALLGKGWANLGLPGGGTAAAGRAADSSCRRSAGAAHPSRTLGVGFTGSVRAVGYNLVVFDYPVWRVPMQIVPARSIAFLIISTLASAAIQETEGPVSTSYISSHFQTLLGEEGPNSKSITARQDVLSRAIDFVFQPPGKVLVGVGLGPDLTFGQWIGDEEQLVRNPHNSYLETLPRTGFLGFTFWMMLLVFCVMPIAQRPPSGSDPVERFCCWTFAGSLVSEDGP